MLGRILPATEVRGDSREQGAPLWTVRGRGQSRGQPVDECFEVIIILAETVEVMAPVADRANWGE